MTNELKHLDEFQKILTDYHVSEKGRSLLHQTDLLLLAAPTSAGRNTIIRELTKTDRYYHIISDTTRKPRINDGVPEQNGVEYWFKSEEEVLSDLRSGAYLEAAIIHNQQVSGISLHEIERAKNKQKIAVKDIEVVGVDTIMNAKPDSLAVFVLPTDFEEWQKRLRGRGDMDEAEYHRRLKSSVNEFRVALNYDYYRFVINDTVEHAVEQIEKIVNGKPDEGLQDRGKALTEQLLAETVNWLKDN